MSKHSFYIDKITNSIEDAATGKSIDTEVQPLMLLDLKRSSKKMGGGLTGKRNFSTVTVNYINW